MRLWMRWLLNLTIAITPAAVATAQVVNGDVVLVGYRTGASGEQGAASVFRRGDWTPVILQLSSQGSQVFQGALRIEGIDLDGDRVQFTDPQVAITPDAGVKRIWCYFCVNEQSDLPSSVDVLGEDGQLLRHIPMIQNVSDMRAGSQLIVDISDRPITELSLLGAAGDTEDVHPFYRGIVASRMAASELPDRWIGLESVNIIIWDQPNPSQVSPAQIEAIKKWVERGGQLIIGLGASWDRVSKSEIAQLLPLAGTVRLADTTKLDHFLDEKAAIVRSWPADTPREFKSPIPVVIGQLTPDSWDSFAEFAPDHTRFPLVSMRMIGSGRVVAVATSIRDLQQVRPNPEAFFNLLFDLNKHTPEYITAAANASNGSMALTGVDKRLHEPVAALVSFARESAALGLIVFGFVLLYLAAAVLSYFWLARRSAAYLSWTVFAGFAVVGSAVSLFTVFFSGGVFSDVQTVTIVDVAGGEKHATARALIGYKAPSRQVVDLSIPGEGSSLKPMPRGGRIRNEYVTPSRYISDPARGELRETLIRATLKQFEATWSGSLGGTIRSELVADRATGRLTPESWVLNDLGIPLYQGYILYVDPRLQGDVGVPVRVSGRTRGYLTDKSPDLPAGFNIIALPLGKLDSSARVTSIGSKIYDDVAKLQDDWSKATASEKTPKWHERPDLPTLYQQHYMWANPTLVGSVLGMATDPWLANLLLASTQTYYLPVANDRKFDSAGSFLRSDGLTMVDISHWLMAGQAVIIAASDRPGPVELLSSGQALRASRGVTLYRARLPLSYIGAPPAPRKEPETLKGSDSP